MESSTTLADRTLALMREATWANLSDPFRVGELIELPTAGEVMVVGDLHGNQSNYEAALRAADLVGATDRHLILQELVHDLGALDGRPCGSWQLVEMTARLKTMFPERVHLLLGNHEMAELCDMTVAKYGCVLNERLAEGVRGAYGERADDVMEVYREFWRTLPLAARTAHGVFVCHSTPGLRKMEPFSLAWFREEAGRDELSRRSPAFDLIWGRDYRQETADEFARRVESELLLVGHTPVEDGYASPNTRHIILDSTDRRGVYVILPLDRPVSREDVLRRVRRLFPEGPAE